MEFLWNFFWTFKIYSTNIPQIFHSNFTFQPVGPRKHGLWHSAPWYANCPHQHPGSPPKGGSSPPYPRELCAKNIYSTNIPLFPIKVKLYLSLILEACMANWGWAQGWRWCAPTYNITPPCDTACTTESEFMKYSSFGSQGFLATNFYSTEYSTNIPLFWGPFLLLMLPELSTHVCLGRGCAIGGYPPQVPSNCHWWRWSVTWLDLTWHTKVDKGGINVEFMWNIPVLTLRPHLFHFCCKCSLILRASAVVVPWGDTHHRCLATATGEDDLWPDLTWLDTKRYTKVE